MVCHPATMTHAPVSAEALEVAGIKRNLIRLSVGLESGEDLVADLLDGFEAVRRARHEVEQLAPIAAVC